MESGLLQTRNISVMLKHEGLRVRTDCLGGAANLNCKAGRLLGDSGALLDTLAFGDVAGFW